jgi:hypothetical protein
MTTTPTIETGAHSGGLPTQAVHNRAEGVVQVVIMLAVAAMAGAASFTHIHDWTMHNSPPGTGDWFGWANAMVSELIPLAAGLEARRRRRRYGKAGLYPIVFIIGAVALSLTGQFAEAKPSLSGWIVAAVPAIGFLALVKLILSPPKTPAAAPTEADPATEEPVDSGQSAPAPVQDHPTEPPAMPEPVAVPTHLLPTARFALAQHEQAAGRPITADELAARMSLTPAVAGQLLVALSEPTAAIPATVNGTSYPAGRP